MGAVSVCRDYFALAETLLDCTGGATTENDTTGQ